MSALLRYCCFFVLFGLSACGSRPDVSVPAPERETVFLNEGQASYYGARHHGRKTASGERFNKNALTAAHKTLPFGSKVRVTNLRNQRSVVVRINDRGPYAKRRVIDLSEQAAREIGMIRSGVAPVRLELLK
ncbi:septal ring lytic transglycosylase RlpA family protein [Oceanimonas doudoroffii]|uniref:Endolytic peptidoglycan transglycosylase RlpA n=1 Tax=Oceanimonas doudoroffii TaxID=84158 RepID=A0A233RG48_9GAMM|nr:septal ring lytic transglycosylase RlpA family protein [Oceanimonas doudoroffii]OXY82362.1 septal ring lytic transglycosylase RlpA family lipoprotein [Oceanimonas doudoroffii]